MKLYDGGFFVALVLFLLAVGILGDSSCEEVKLDKAEIEILEK